MLDSLDYLLRCFNESTDWNDDNFYSNLTAVSSSKHALVTLLLTLFVGLLDFRTPRGLRLNTASFATDQFTASATLSALPILEGSIAYTFTSKPLRGIQGTASSPLVDLVQAFREIKLPRAPEDAKDWEIWQAGRRVDFRGTSDSPDPANSDSLYYGRMYLPASRLEGMFIRRASPAWQYIFSFVTDPHPGRGSAVSYIPSFS